MRAARRARCTPSRQGSSLPRKLRPCWPQPSGAMAHEFDDCRWRPGSGATASCEVCSMLPCQCPTSPAVQPVASLSLSSAALLGRNIIPPVGARIELAWTPDLLLDVLDHLLPLGDPADRPCERKQSREHVVGKTQRLQGNARIEIDVRIELLLDEIVILQRDALEFQRGLKQRIATLAELIKYGIALIAHHLGPRIIVLVHAMSEPHQSEAVVLILGSLHVFGHAIDAADFLQHLQRG